MMLSIPPRQNTKLILMILALFSVAMLRMDDAGGTDISASYVSCRLLVSGQSEHLFSYDPSYFNLISDPVWNQVAATTGFPPGMQLSPFVQTPLWPYILQPLCRTTNFPIFNYIFATLLAVSFSGLIWITARYWAPRTYTPLWILLIAILWVKADPLRDAMQLTQTHAMFLLLSLVAVLLAERRWPVTAGALLAIAAAVKLTPALLAIYWLMSRRRSAALSFVLCSVALCVATLAAVGYHTTFAYVESVRRVSNVLLTSANNQSLAAWMEGARHPLGFAILPLPRALKMLCLGLTVVCAVIGGYWDRGFAKFATIRAPYGAVLTLLAATIFTPIAWSHYYILLVVPLILILDDAMQNRSWYAVLLFGGVFGLANSKVLGRQLHHVHFQSTALVRAQFYAGLLAMAAMAILHYRTIRPDRAPG